MQTFDYRNLIYVIIGTQEQVIVKHHKEPSGLESFKFCCYIFFYIFTGIKSIFFLDFSAGINSVFFFFLQVWKAKQEEEAKVKMAESARYKAYRRYMKKGGPGQMTFGPE